MAIWEFCGKEIPEGGICDYAASAADTETVLHIGDEKVSSEDEISEKKDIIEDDKPEEPVTDETEKASDEPDPLGFLDSDPQYVPENNEEKAPDEVKADVPPPTTDNIKPQPAAPARPVQRRRRVSKKTLMRRRRCALVVILFLLFMGCSLIKNHTGCRGAVHQYWSCVVDEDGGENYYSMGLPKVLINHFKDSGQWDNLIDNYENLSEKAVKLKKIKSVKRMTKDELHNAESYLYDLAHYYGATTADGEIVADKGYFVTVIYKFGDDRILGGAYYVKMEDDCWKVLPQDINK